MLPTGHFWEFLVTVYLVILIPGPSVMFVVSRGLALGRRAAISTVLGNCCGFATQLILVSFGLGAVIASSDTVFEVLKLAGAAYVAYLGIQKIRHRHELAGILTSGSIAPRRLRTAIREGFIVGVTNPKGLVIFTAILPPFIDRAQGHDTLQLLTLGAICIAIAFLSDSLWGIFSGTARHWFGRSPKRLERLSATGGVMLVGLGVGLAVTGNRS
ncbi:MAG TPA: LysE family translocator [Solirubrobacteraceae bacterium]|nr:LysE family translocator [Solirubrobacteraceae bacterium]